MSTATAIRNATASLKLDFPLEYQGAAITELRVRRPKGKDMRWLPKGNDPGVDEMYPFFALLCGCEEGVFDEMDASDLGALGEIVNGFLSAKKPKRK